MSEKIQETLEEAVKEIVEELEGEPVKETIEETTKETEESSKEEATEIEEMPEEEEVPKKEETSEVQKKRWSWKKTMLLIGGILALVVLVYVGVSAYFEEHLYLRTSINGIDFSGKTVEDVYQYMQQGVEDYILTIKGKDGKTEVITGADIELKYEKLTGLEQELERQRPLKWGIAALEGEEITLDLHISYNEEKLNERLLALECLKPENQVAAVAATPVLSGDRFVIQEETYGTVINQEVLQKVAASYVMQLKNELSLEEEACYIPPKFTRDSQEVKTACDALNKCLTAQITYSLNSHTDIIDKALIAQWIGVDADMNLAFHTDAMKKHIDSISGHYNTVGKVRTITSPTGKQAQVSGGTYGWKVSRDGECEALIANMKAGEVVTREPVYMLKGVSRDEAEWGTTYVEVDITEQHMWYIVDGQIAFETDVITGLKGKNDTPQGTYYITEKVPGKYLIGRKGADGKPIYKTWVNQWMRITNSGIGFHDAPWQDKYGFGGDTYVAHGSHGCVNMPPAKALEFYKMIQIGCPVIVHY